MAREELQEGVLLERLQELELFLKKPNHCYLLSAVAGCYQVPGF